MAEIVDFIRRGAMLITPAILEKIHRKLPLWKAEYSQIQSPEYPHLAEQLMFLTNVVEDFADGVAKDIPYVTIAQAIFALSYAHKSVDIIPDTVPDMGHADDSSVVRAVLIQNEKVLAKRALEQGCNWSRITSKP